MRYTLLVVLLSSLSFAQVKQPTLTPQWSGTTQLLIAVSPVNSQVVWASGTGGTFVVTTDGGNHWRSGVVPGAEALQFRDVQGVSANVAYLMSIGDNTTDFRIYKTSDGGATWNQQFTNELAGAFYDCMAFWAPNRGLAHSDSVNGQFPELRTLSGQKWHSIESAMPPALSGEASFSSSGTCIATQGDSNAWVTLGGATVSRILATTDGGNTWNAYDTPLISNPSAGGLSVAFRDGQHGIVGGGDLAVNYRIQLATSENGGKTWTLTRKPPIGGTIFALAYASGSSISATAKDSSDRRVVITSEDAPDFAKGAAAWTPDEGETWYRISGASGYWGLAFADPSAGWFVGNNGQILKISF
ncbi:MAG: WD40/YVTN/BNR-like repeat-containing protein [Candidatus Sulfotelmatobacter sp.]